MGRPLRVPRFPQLLPPPPPAVLVVLRRAVEVPAGLEDHVGHLVGEVLVLGLEGPDGEELPEDLVGLASTCKSQMGEEHEVRLRLPVELEDHEDLHPALLGHAAPAALNLAPEAREDPLDPSEELELEVLEGRVPGVLDVPEGPVGLRMLMTNTRSSKRACLSSRIFRRCLVPPVRCMKRCWRSRLHGSLVVLPSHEVQEVPKVLAGLNHSRCKTARAIIIQTAASTNMVDGEGDGDG